MAQGSEEAEFAQTNLITLTIVFGNMPPVCLKGSKLLATAFYASALAADITGDVYDRFRRLINDVLHGQYLQRRAEGGTIQTFRIASFLQISLTRPRKPLRMGKLAIFSSSMVLCTTISTQ
jgi:hypothetical protein